MLNLGWTQAAKGKVMLTPKHLSNAFSEPHTSRTLQLVGVYKILKVECEFNLVVERISLNKVVEEVVQPMSEKLK